MKDSSRSVECLVDVLKDDEGLADGEVAMEEHGGLLVDGVVRGGSCSPGLRG